MRKKLYLKAYHYKLIKIEEIITQYGSIKAKNLSHAFRILKKKFKNSDIQYNSKTRNIIVTY